MERLNLMKAIGRYLLTILPVLAIAIGYVIAVPPPRSSHAQLASVQTWAGSSAGSVNAIQLTVHNISALGDLLGVPIRFLSSGSGNNTGAVTVTINLDGGGTLGPVVLKRPTTNLGLQLLSGSELGTNNVDEITYDGTQFVITSHIDMTPIGTTIDYRPGSGQRGYLIEDGSCVSQTTYAALFSLLGSTYGSCSAGLFALPDSRGTTTMALDGQGVNGSANRITATSCATPNTLGAHCGGDTRALSAPNLPPYTPTGTIAGTITNGAITTTISPNSNLQQSSGVVQVANGGSFFSYNNVTPTATSTQAASTFAGTFTGSAQGGTSTAFPVLNPTLLAFRMIKY
jgi:microcystin-dependent protein